MNTSEVVIPAFTGWLSIAAAVLGAWLWWRSRPRKAKSVKSDTRRDPPPSEYSATGAAELEESRHGAR